MDPPASPATTVAGSPAASTLSPVATAMPIAVAASHNANDVVTGTAPVAGPPARAPSMCL
jgi:hypothetical protein